MIIYTPTASLLIARYPEDSASILITSRRAGDIEAFMRPVPGLILCVEEFPGEDYPWRAVVQKALFGQAFMSQLALIDYDAMRDATTNSEQLGVLMDIDAADSRARAPAFIPDAGMLNVPVNMIDPDGTGRIMDNYLPDIQGYFDGIGRKVSNR